MLNPLIRTLNGWRFELPLALVLGASAAFATIAMPHHLFGKLPGVTASGFERPIQILLALVVAVAAAGAGYLAMKLPTVVAVAEPEEEEEAFAVPPIDVAVRLRRADAHPDFPPREPIRASRDLGEPFMKIRSVAAQAQAEPAQDETIPDGDFVELVEFAPTTADADEPVAEAIDPPVDAAPVVEAIEQPAAEAPTAQPELTEWPLSKAVRGKKNVVAPAPVATPDEEPHAAIAAFEPDPVVEPAPRPERRRESLADMMERLSAGLDRRSGKPVAPPPAAMLAEVLARPRAAKPDMRDALDELNRLAGRRD